LKFRPYFVPSSFENQSAADKCSKGFVSNFTSVFLSDFHTEFFASFFCFNFLKHVPFFWVIYFSFFLYWIKYWENDRIKEWIKGILGT
jgi:hypothetical protein